MGHGSHSSASSSHHNEVFLTPPEDVAPIGDLALEHDGADVDLSFRPVEAVDVRVEDLNVNIDISPRFASLTSMFKKERKAIERKQILKHVNAFMPSGSVTAILGSSGSGKTSVLNTLSRRIEGGRLITNGRVLYNGDTRLSSLRSAYVMQQDVLMPTLTIRETLEYAAELRLPPPTTAEERHRVVEEVILELGLKDCANTRIGNNIHKGCSGGEKRRCSLAVQMLANPSVLFLDEVTTGLDASTAYQLVVTLKNLARKGRTIILTIHQPRSEIYSLFDNVLLLAVGSVLYSGLARKCLPYFESIGYQAPELTNPAEYLIDQAAIDNRSPEAEAMSVARVEELMAAWKAHSYDLRIGETDLEKDIAANTKKNSPDLRNALNMATDGHHAGFVRQVRVLTRRTFKVTWRDPYGMAGSLFEATMMSIISGWIFLHLDGSLQGIRSREGGLFISSSLQSYLVMLYELYRLTTDVSTFDREYGEGVINIPAWLLGRRIARFGLEDIPVPLIYSVIFYFMAGFRLDASQFFVFFSVLLLMHHIAINVATVCVALSREFAVASLFANSIFTLQSLAGGYFVQPNQIPIWVRWLKVRSQKDES